MARRDEEPDPIRRPRPDNFYYGALRLRAEEQHSTHPDAVAAARDELQGYPCISMPPALGLTCSQSALFLAAQLTKGKSDTTHALLLRVGNLTPPQMRRALERMTLAHFPVYLLIPEHGPHAEDYTPDFVPFRGSKHREDNWAIVYLPPDELNEAHWTFTQISQPVETQDPQPVQAIAIVYTHLPWQPVEGQFWRCKLTRNNQRAYLEARALDRACCCDMYTKCTHEVKFAREAGPGLKKVSLLDGIYVDGSARGQLGVCAAVKRAPKCVAIATACGQTDRLQCGYDCESVLDIGRMTSPFSLISSSLFHRTIEPWNWYNGETETILEIPEKVENLQVGGLAVTAFTYQPRYGIYNLIQIGVTATTGFALLNYGVKRLLPRVNLGANVPSPIPYVHRTSFFQHYYSSVSQFFRGCGVKLVNLLDFSPKLTLPKISAPETRAQSAYRGIYESIALTISSTRSMTLCKYAVCTSSTIFGFYLLRQSYIALMIRIRRDRLVPFVPTPQDSIYGNAADLSLTLPAPAELNARLACLPTVTADHAYDLLRRVTAEHNWLVHYNRHEVEVWIERVLTTPGKTRLEFDKPGKCLNCKQLPMTYRYLCKLCWARLRASPIIDALYISDQLVTYIGVKPIFSSEFNFPANGLKDTAIVRLGNKRTGKVLFDKKTAPGAMQDWYKSQHVKTSYRGRSCGPIFMGQTPKCFPRGDETAVVAFLIRLGGKAPAVADPTWIDRLIGYFARERVPQLEGESRDTFLTHFTGTKLAKMLAAERSINDGLYVSPDPRRPVCKMSGFTKAEKSYWFSFFFYLFLAKTEVKPRFICCPSPEFLFTIGPYTHAQTKWLGHQYTCRDNLFYAGCAKPDELNQWLNMTIQQLGTFVTIADDITACDSSHSAETMRFHTAARKKLFVTLSDYIELHYLAEHSLKIRVGRYRLSVENVNGSGVSDTSFKNSLLCMFIRLLAVAHAVRDLSTFTDPRELYRFLDEVRVRIFSSASGDDGLTRLLRFMMGTDMTTSDAIARYEEMWGYFGFKVKVAVYPETQWRLATYLAMRPTWTGKFYEWTPEPARRMRGMFWQVDNSMHPIVWGRSVATGVKAVASANPILGPLVKWYLANTQGPIVETAVFDNPHSVWHNYQLQGTQITDRAISEMLTDYELSPRDYDIYLSIFRQTPSVFVDINCRLIAQIYRCES